MKVFNFIVSVLLIISILISCKKNVSTQNPASPTDLDTSKINDIIYTASSSSGTVYALNAKDGSIKWSTNLYSNLNYSGIHSSPTLVDGILYLGCPPNRVVAIDARTGIIKWNSILGIQSNAFYCSPLVANNILYIGRTNKFYGINATDGTIKWSFTESSGGAIANQFDASSPCIFQNVVYVNAVDCPNEGLYGFDAQTGVVKLFNNQGGAKYASVTSPCVYNNVIYNAFTNNAYGSGSFYKLNLTNYQPIPGNFYLPSTCMSSPTVFNGTVYFGSANYLFSYDDNSNNTNPLKWQFQFSSAVSNSSPTADSNNVYIGCGNRFLYAIKTSDGSKRWEYNTFRNSANNGGETSPTLANGIIYYGTPDGLFAITAETGSLVWYNSGVGRIYSSPCVISKTGEIFHSGISGVKN